MASHKVIICKHRHLSSFTLSVCCDRGLPQSSGSSWTQRTTVLQPNGRRSLPSIRSRANRTSSAALGRNQGAYSSQRHRQRCKFSVWGRCRPEEEARKAQTEESAHAEHRWRHLQHYCVSINGLNQPRYTPCPPSYTVGPPQSDTVRSLRCYALNVMSIHRNNSRW